MPLSPSQTANHSSEKPEDALSRGEIEDSPAEKPGLYDAPVDRLFCEDGPFRSAISEYRLRPLQVEMAKAIAQTIADAKTLVAEAGTGTGKTFAYLVPALLWGGKVIISTGTRNLQDQLFLRDIPMVRKSLQTPVTVALLKGRANYLCHFHLARTVEYGRLNSRTEVGQLRAIQRFQKTTRTGDRSELSAVPENALIWNQVTSTKDNCTGAECAHYQDCFVMKARKEAQQADVVVVNHHLFFADIALKDTGVAELLPTANTVIFDEAHQLPDTASLFFGESISTSHILELCRDTLVEGLAHARDGADWAKLIAPVERDARELRLTFPETSTRMAVNQIASSSALFDALDKLIGSLSALTAVLDNQAERGETLQLCRNRAVEVGDLLQRWFAVSRGKAPVDKVLWVEAFGTSLQLHQTPLSIAPIFNKQREDRKIAWIFTSATLAVKNSFDYFSVRMGLENESSRIWDSPFDYAQQGLLYVPPNMPEPHVMGYTDAVVDAALPLIEASGGRAFVLCTTLRAVSRVAERLREEFEKRQWAFPLFVQGESGRTELLDRFRAAGNGVLVGSQSFWEGVDVRGEALSLVIVDKLPFAPPDDPVLAARIDVLEKEGGNGFMQYQLPEAIMSLKQGAGRLIRDETDRGVLMVCDPRLISKSYGRRIWQSLPPFTRTREQEEACRFFGERGAMVGDSERNSAK